MTAPDTHTLKKNEKQNKKKLKANIFFLMKCLQLSQEAKMLRYDQNEKTIKTQTLNLKTKCQNFQTSQVNTRSQHPSVIISCLKNKHEPLLIYQNNQTKI